MKFLSFLFGSKKKDIEAPPKLPKTINFNDGLQAKPASGSQRRARIQWREASFPMEVVGESNYQDALVAVCGRHTRDGIEVELDALIELEPTNPHDPNAVVVKIADYTIGYLPREQAVQVGMQMRKEGLSAVACGARVRGGWRTNQYDQGHYGVRLAIPNHGWIDFGIGSTPPSTPTRAWPRNEGGATMRPEAAATGSLEGHRIALMGATGDSAIAHQLAAAGAKIMAGVGKRTTLLVINADEPFDYGIKRSATYQKAEEMIAQGTHLRIVSIKQVQAMMA